MISTAAELALGPKRQRGAQGWCVGSGVGSGMNAEWQQREEARRHLQTEPNNSNLRKAVKMAGENIGKNRKPAVLNFFWVFVRKLETFVREGDHAGLYKHSRAMKLERERDRSSAYKIQGRHTPEER